MKKISKAIIRISAVAAASLFAVTLSSCGSTIGEITGVKFDSEKGMLTWDKNEIVEKYNVFINGEKVVDGSTDTSVQVDTSKLVEGTDATVEIEGMDGKDNVLAEVDTAIKVLPNLQINVVDGFYDWSATVNEFDLYATDGYSVSYVVVVDNVVKSENYTDTKMKVEAGEHKIGVKPVLNGNALYYSTYTYDGTKLLSKPVNVNLEKNKVTWTDVDFFESVATYSVKVNDTVFDTHTNHFDVTKVLPDYENVEELQITVQAVSSSDEIQSSEVSDVFRFVQLGAVQNAVIDGDTLRWAEVARADAYEIEINGKVAATVKGTEYALGGNASVDIRVRAVDTTATRSYSAWSSLVTARTLGHPDLMFSGSNILWAEVSNASSYNLVVTRYVYDESKNLVEDSVVFNEDIGKVIYIDPSRFCEEEGIYKFKVSAVPYNGTGYSQSAFSNELTVVRLGNAMDFTISETDPRTPYGQINLALSGIYEGAKYVLRVNGNVVGTSLDGAFSICKLFTSYNPEDSEHPSTDLSLTIEAQPKMNEALNDKLYLPSLKKMEITLAQLETPQNVKYEYDAATGLSYVSWDANPHALGYGILIDDILETCPVTNVDPNNSKRVRYPIERGYEAAAFNITVFTMGANLQTISETTQMLVKEYEYEENVDESGNTEPVVAYVTSSYSSTLRFKTLGSPKDIRFNYNDGEISWSEVPGATGYRVFAYPVGEERGQYGHDVTSPYIKTAELEEKLAGKEVNSVAICVIALGNCEKEISATDTIVINSQLSAISDDITYTYLPAPVIRISERNITWDAITGAAGYQIYINGRRYEGNKGTDVTSFAMTEKNEVEGRSDREFTVQVVAVADGNNFNSVKSNKVTFMKLETPQVRHFDDDRTAYYIEYQEGTYRYQINVTGVGNSRADNQSVIVSDDNLVKMKVMENGVEVDKLFVKYIPVFTNMVNPTIEITAVAKTADQSAENAKVYMSSNTSSFTQIIRTIEAPINPMITAAYSDGMLHITTDVVNPYGLGYTYYDGQTKLGTVETNTYDLPVQTSGKHSISIGYQGELFIADRETDAYTDYVYYLSSTPSDSSVEITQLATVRPGDIDLGYKNEVYTFVANYTKVSNGQYSYKYTVVDDNGVVKYESDMILAGTVGQVKINMTKEDFKKYEGLTLKVEIYSIGNDGEGSGTIVSNPVAAIATTYIEY